MHPDLQKILQKLFQAFVDGTTDVQGVIDGLFSREAFNRNIQQRIQGKDLSSDKMRELLTVLPKRPDQVMNDFYYVLDEVGEDELADRLYKELQTINRAPPPKMPTSPSATAGQPSPVGSSGDGQSEDVLPANWLGSSNPLRLQVIKVTDDVMKGMYENARKGTTEMFPMYRDNRGRCLLINNWQFSEGTGYRNRQESDHDQLALQNLFDELGFMTKSPNNLTAQQIIDAVDEEAKRYSKCDSFVCAVLTHGESGALVGVDGKLVALEELMATVSADRCPDLVEKPKLFIFLACEGGKEDKGTAVGDEAGAGDKVKESTDLGKKMESLTLHGDSDTEKMLVKENIYIIRATIPDSICWQNGGVDFKGTWFVQALVYTLATLSHKYSLATLMSKVNDLVKKSDENKDGLDKVLEVISVPPKDLYFFPGLWE